MKLDSFENEDFERLKLIDREIKERTYHRKEIGESVQRYRLVNGITIKELAYRLNIDPIAIRQMEEGFRGLNLDHLVKLTEIFNVDANEIVFNLIPDPRTTPTAQKRKELIDQVSNLNIFALDHIIDSVRSMEKIRNSKNKKI